MNENMVALLYDFSSATCMSVLSFYNGQRVKGTCFKPVIEPFNILSPINILLPPTGHKS